MQEDLDRLRGVEKLLRRQKHSRSIDLAIERCQDCDKKKLKSSIDKPHVERCRRAVEIALKKKQIFKDGKAQI